MRVPRVRAEGEDLRYIDCCERMREACQNVDHVGIELDYPSVYMDDPDGSERCPTPIQYCPWCGTSLAFLNWDEHRIREQEEA